MAFAQSLTAATDRPPVLGVEQSVTGQFWEQVPSDPRQALALAQAAAGPDLLGQILAARGLQPEQVADFLEPRVRQAMPDPAVLCDMDKAAALAAAAIIHQEPVAVFGDYDVDGATSSALLRRYWRAVGQELQIYVPDRIREGYGPNSAALRTLAAAGISLVICVDCGTTAHQPLADAAAAGLRVLVLDHHTAEPALPPVAALVNPNRLDDRSGLGYLAAVGVTFLFLVALSRNLRAQGFFTARPEPDLLLLLDLVALGTVCDVVPLVGLNRALVAQGLKVAAARSNGGLAALADVAGLRGVPDAYALGFLLGPRVNAGGRVGAADLGARLLSDDSPAATADLAARLDQLNRERQQIEATVLDEALGVAAAQADAPLLLVAGEGWHPGVIGIVAARLKERFHRPTMVIALDGDLGKGSGRSIGGIDLGALVIAARQAGLLVNGGGHAMAAGLTVARDRLPALRAFFAARLADLPAGMLRPRLRVDGLCSLGAATTELAAALCRLEPFGTANPEPRLVFPDCRIIQAQPMGNGDHWRCVLAGPAIRLRAVAFRATANGLGPFLQKAGSAHIAGKLRCNEWQGQMRAEIVIDDAAQASI